MLFIVIINALICPLPQPLRFPGYCISHNLSSNIGSAIIVSLAYCLSPQYFFVLTLAFFECHRLLWIPLQVMLCFHYQSQNQWHSCVSLNYDLLLLWRHKFLVKIHITCFCNYKFSKRHRMLKEQGRKRLQIKWFS